MNEVIILVVLLALSALFSGSEIAFFSLSHLRVRFLIEKNVKGANALQRLKAKPEHLLITILIGNNVVNILASAMATVIAIERFNNMGVGVATGVMTFLILIFGEITPKAFSTQHAEKIALMLSPPMRIIQIILYPLIFLLNGINKLLTGLISKPSDYPLVTEDEIRNIVTVGEEQGEIKKIEKELIHNVFKFDEIAVKDIMTPRKDIVAIDIDSTTEEIVKTLSQTKVTRIPVYKDELDHIKGILRSKDLLDFVNNKNEINLVKLITKPFIVPETRMIDSLLREFQRRKEHLAVVVDEYGSITGIITLEDLLEEIVGDIYDEFDEIEHDVIKVNDKLAIVGGNADIIKVNKKLGLSIKEGNDYNTIGGFILKKIGHIPMNGERIAFDKFDLIIERTCDNHIEELKIIKKD